MSDRMAGGHSVIDRYSLWLLLPAILVALLLHLLPGSTYASAEAMDAYFGYENSPGSWTWEHGPDGSWEKEWEPFKYRIVFRGLVDSLAHLFLLLGAPKDIHTYWLAFISVSVAAHSFAIWACDQMLRVVGLSLRARLTGILAWTLLPPIFMAYILPVQTKEDFLAYGLFFLALRAMLRSDWTTVVLICVAGAFVRETLLMAPGLLFLGTNAPRRIKLTALLLPIAVHVGLRVTMGVDGYQVFRETNLLSVLLPLFALAITFGYGWVPLVRYIARAEVGAGLRRGLAGFLPVRVPPLITLQDRLDALQSAFPYALILLFVAQFFMGRIQEIRITGLLTPFVLLALINLFGNKRLTARTIVWGLVGGGIAAIAIGALEVLGVMTALRLSINPLIGEFAHQKWWAVVYLQAILGVAVIVAAKVAPPQKDRGDAPTQMR